MQPQITSKKKKLPLLLLFQQLFIDCLCYTKAQIERCFILLVEIIEMFFSVLKNINLTEAIVGNT